MAVERRGLETISLLFGVLNVKVRVLHWDKTHPSLWLHFSGDKTRTLENPLVIKSTVQYKQVTTTYHAQYQPLPLPPLACVQGDTTHHLQVFQYHQNYKKALKHDLIQLSLTHGVSLPNCSNDLLELSRGRKIDLLLDQVSQFHLEILFWKRVCPVERDNLDVTENQAYDSVPVAYDSAPAIYVKNSLMMRFPDWKNVFLEKLKVMAILCAPSVRHAVKNFPGVIHRFLYAVLLGQDVDDGEVEGKANTLHHWTSVMEHVKNFLMVERANLQLYADNTIPIKQKRF